MWHIQLKAVKCIVFSRFPFLSEALRSLQQFIKTLITILGRKLIENNADAVESLHVILRISLYQIFFSPFRQMSIVHSVLDKVVDQLWLIM